MPTLPPPFIANSVPKSGTHLLHQMLNGIPGVHNDMRRADKKFFADPYKGDYFADHDRRLRQLVPGEFGVCHIQYSERYARMLDNIGIRHIFLYRDPRDVAVSLAYFIPEKWPDHPLHHEFRLRVTDTRARIRMIIAGVPGKFPSFMEYMGPFYGWLRHQRCLKVTFESLMESPRSRRDATLRILSYLWQGSKPPQPLEQMADRMIASINPAASATFRKGKIGEWRREFDDELKALSNKHLAPLLALTGFAPAPGR